MADELFAWDLTFKSIENDLIKKEDLLVAFTHWYLIKLGFVCIGNGTSRTLAGNEVRSETLPPNWNRLNDFNLRYVYEEKVYLFRGTVTGGDIIFNFLRAEDLSISSCMFQIEDEVKELKGDIATMMPNYKHVMEVLKRELVSPVFTRPTCVVGTQTQETPSSSLGRSQMPDDDIVDPLRARPRRPLITPGLDPFWNPAIDPRSIGRNDVDPFGQGIGGGMLFDPFRPRRDPRGPGPNFPDGLPRGAVPPGARFDPFGPPGTGRGGRPDPDPDHLPPPGYDDMFM